MYTRSSTEMPPDWININNNSKANLYKIMRELKIVPPENAEIGLLIRLIKEKLATSHTEPYKSPKTFKKPANNKKAEGSDEDTISPQVATPDQEEFNDDDDMVLGLDPMSSDVELPKPNLTDHPNAGIGLERQASLVALEERANQPEVIVSPALSPSISNRYSNQIESNAIERAAISSIGTLEFNLGSDSESPMQSNGNISSQSEYRSSIFPRNQTIDPPPQQAQRINSPTYAYLHVEITKEIGPRLKPSLFLWGVIVFGVGIFLAMILSTIKTRIYNHFGSGSLEDKAEKYVTDYYRKCMNHYYPLYTAKFNLSFPNVNMTELMQRGIVVTNRVIYKDEELSFVCRAVRKLDIHSVLVGFIIIVVFISIVKISKHLLD